jgi:hypothetical protein
MNKLFARLATGATLVASLGGTALADSASIELTGPGSTNIIDVRSSDFLGFATTNRVHANNWNWQQAHSGDVRIRHNTKVWGDGGSSGDAWNSNSGQNWVNINNDCGNWWGGGTMARGSQNASIFLTGPHSFNRISAVDNNRFTQTTRNQVNTSNFSNQTARSGNVTITGNTVVTGVGGSGSAANENVGTNDVSISNSAAMPTWQPSDGSGGSASISTTGPHSNNQIRLADASNTTITTTNTVSATNFSHQTATSGNVTISGNTVVSGVGGSGDAFNTNTGTNSVDISNN